MDITSLYSVNSGMIAETLREQQAAGMTSTSIGNKEEFAGILGAAMENYNGKGAK